MRLVENEFIPAMTNGAVCQNEMQRTVNTLKEKLEEPDLSPAAKAYYEVLLVGNMRIVNCLNELRTKMSRMANDFHQYAEHTGACKRNPCSCGLLEAKRTWSLK